MPPITMAGAMTMPSRTEPIFRNSGHPFQTFAKNYLQNQYAAIRILKCLRINGRIAEQDITRSVAQYVIAYGSYQQLQVSRELTALLANEKQF